MSRALLNVVRLWTRWLDPSSFTENRLCAEVVSNAVWRLKYDKKNFKGPVSKISLSRKKRALSFLFLFFPWPYILFYYTCHFVFSLRSFIFYLFFNTFYSFHFLLLSLSVSFSPAHIFLLSSLFVFCCLHFFAHLVILTPVVKDM